MRLAVGIVLSVILLLAKPAVAATGLASVPMIVPALGRASCACVNLTTESIDITLRLDDGVPALMMVGPGLSGTLSVVGGLSASMTYCQVFRSGGGSVTTKQLACSISSVDGDDTPRVVVPLDRKIRQ